MAEQDPNKMSLEELEANALKALGEEQQQEPEEKQPPRDEKGRFVKPEVEPSRSRGRTGRLRARD
jgi:hypothetical protein